MVDYDSAFRVEQRDDKFDVVNQSDVVVMECRDEASAQHYAQLLSKAYSAGYKSGLRHGRSQNS